MWCALRAEIERMRALETGGRTGQNPSLGPALEWPAEPARP